MRGSPEGLLPVSGSGRQGIVSASAHQAAEPVYRHGVGPVSAMAVAQAVEGSGHRRPEKIGGGEC